MPEKPSIFTAGQIAALLRCDARVIRRELEGVAPDHDGAGRRAWHFETLPAALRQRIEAESKRQGFEDAEKSLAFDHANHGWQPALPLAECAEGAITEATKLRQALVRTIALKDDVTISRAELVRMGLEDWRRVFRPKPERMITERRWFDLFHRTLDRAGSAWPLDSLEIYLPERPSRKVVAIETASQALELVPVQPTFAELHATISGLANPLQPTSAEKKCLWDAACRWCRRELDAGRSQKEAREELFDFLTKHASGSFQSRNTLRVAFDRAWRAWVDTEGLDALKDKRAEANERRGKPTDELLILEVIYTAVRQYRGRLAPAVREVMGGKLGGRKSYVPERLRQLAGPAVAAAYPHHQGRRYADKASPSLDLGYDGISPMDCVVMDDFTFNSYAWHPLPDGDFKLTRGQVILAVDFRTLKVLHFGFIPEEQPNSLLAWEVATKTFETNGVPKVLMSERGKVFADSELMSGGKRARRAIQRAEWDALPMADRKIGLQSLGLTLHICRAARSKPVERVGGLLQDLMDGEPGFAGREERHDMPDELKAQLRAINRGEKHPSAFLYRTDEWADRITAICERYNSAVQQGERLMDVSPADAFKQWWPHSDPPSMLDAGCRAKLAFHHKVVKVRGGAVAFDLRGEHFKYRHHDLSTLENRPALVHLNPRVPEVVTVTDMKWRNAVTVERCLKPNALAAAMGEHDPILEAELAKVKRHQRHWSNFHRTLKLRFEPKFRASLPSREIVELTAATERHDQVLQKIEATAKRENRGRARLNKLGLSAATVARNADVDSGSRELADLMARARKEEEAS